MAMYYLILHGKLTDKWLHNEENEGRTTGYCCDSITSPHPMAFCVHADDVDERDLDSLASLVLQYHPDSYFIDYKGHEMVIDNVEFEECHDENKTSQIYYDINDFVKSIDPEKSNNLNYYCADM